ncbi:hypothetical protein Celaphus_00001680 [Cervus elaphus hippelaphus]|uniref:Uncharacterized protein n=1 Tax=Cervus elaphus hippelaphus TaxID=46360 RepID=A0A212DAN3_CEREH|nr:hypothetical protein Celaphus_00001680 [Cervus elaphus hippelaphus]
MLLCEQAPGERRGFELTEEQPGRASPGCAERPADAHLLLRGASARSAGPLQALSSWPLLRAPPVLGEGAPPKASSTGFLGSRSLHGPRREWWRKRSGSRESSEKPERLLPRHRFDNLDCFL